MIGVGTFLRSSIVTLLAPTLASLNFTQVDVLGGGSDIVATGTNLAGATAVTVGGTSATITGTTDTTVSFQAPAKAAGTYDVAVTTPAGTSTLAGALEAWAPSTQTGCTLFAERPSYASAAGNGTWTARVGTAPANATTAPAASSGSPVFTGTESLDCATLTNLINVTGGSEVGSLAVIANPSAVSAPQASSYYLEDPICEEVADFHFGATLSTSGFRFYTVSGFNYVSAPPRALATGGRHAAVGRFQASSTIDASVDGSSFASSSAALGTIQPALVGSRVVRLGHNGSSALRATLVAIVFFNVKVADSFATKFYKWAQQRHSVT